MNLNIIPRPELKTIQEVQKDVDVLHVDAIRYARNLAMTYGDAWIDVDEIGLIKVYSGRCDNKIAEKEFKLNEKSLNTLMVKFN